MSNEIKEQIIEKNIKLFEENEKVRSKELEDYNLRKNGIMESLKTLLKETIVYRREIKSEKEDLIKERDLLKSKQNFHKEMEKKLSDISLDIYDFSRAIQIYKEVKGNNFEHELLEKAYNHICSKKEEQYRNDLKKFTPKDKQNALKILDEIKTNGLKINEDILKKLSEISGV